MSKQISVGNVVESLNRHFTCYSPVNYFKKYSLNQRDSDCKVIAQLEEANNKIGKSLVKLYRDMLFYCDNKATIHIEKILSFLKNTFEPLIHKLSDPQFNVVKEMYKEWKLEWMLNYIKGSEFLSDREFAERNNIDVCKKEINPSAITLMNRLRNYYFSSDELCTMYKDFSDENEILPELDELDIEL